MHVSCICYIKIFMHVSYFCFAGPFKGLSAEKIENEVGDMYRTLIKLTKQFAELPGPRSVADRMKAKIDKFKLNLPVLSVICNPGLRERHWSAVSF